MILQGLKKIARDFISYGLIKTGLSLPEKHGRGLYIVTFHRVLKKDQLVEYPMKGLAVTEEEFEWFLNLFKKWFDPKCLSEAMADFKDPNTNRKRKKPLLVITLDDGQLDNYLCAFPLLEKYSLKATFFIPFNGVENQSLLWHDRMAYSIKSLGIKRRGLHLLDDLGLDFDKAADLPISGVREAKNWSQKDRNNWILKAEGLIGTNYPEWDGVMTWEQVKKLAENDHEIGSHTISHPLLIQCSDQELIHELTDSRTFISQKIKYPVVSFCYPNGDSDKRVIKAVEQAGYLQAVTTNWGINFKKHNLFELKRLDMTSDHSKDRFGRLSKNRVLMRMAGFKRGK